VHETKQKTFVLVTRYAVERKIVPAIAERLERQSIVLTSKRMVKVTNSIADLLLSGMPRTATFLRYFREELVGPGFVWEATACNVASCLQIAVGQFRGKGVRGQYGRFTDLLVYYPAQYSLRGEREAEAYELLRNSYGR
jgi:hypothetical protein